MLLYFEAIIRTMETPVTIPIISIKCNRCGYSQSSGFSGRREYALPDGQKVRVLTTPAWCHDCGGIESVENLDPTGWIDEVQFVKQRLASIQIDKRLFSKRWTYDGHYWSDETADYRAEVTLETFADWTKRLDEAVAGIQFLISRQSPARCLSCSGTNFDRLERRANPSDPAHELMVHPGCGGLLDHIVEGDIFIKGGYPKSARRYSPDGEYLGLFDGDQLIRR